MRYLYIITAAALLLSLIKDRAKTGKAIRMAAKKLLKILPAFLAMLICISIVLFLVPDRVIVRWLGNANQWQGLVLASLFGSITIMPGFIAFPLAGILLEKGVGYMVLSAFTTTLMMVGVMTYPVEKAYFGHRVTILRNALSFFIALAVALVVGFCFGEWP